jgi:steroid delta-isomerase-like uncharacterized protein
MTADDNRKVIQNFFEKVLNRRNLSVLGDFVSRDYVEHSPTPDQDQGLAGVRHHIETFFTAFSNTRYELEDTIAEGSKVVARWTMTGKHTGAFVGVAPTGKDIRTFGIDIYYLENGKIIEHWHEMDMVSLMAQLNPAR